MRLYALMTLACLVAAAAVATKDLAIAEDERVSAIKELAEEMEPFSISVVGMPATTSEWSFIDRPFWGETVSELSGGKVAVEIRSMSDLNLQGGDVFRLVSQGTVDMADVAAGYGAGELVELDGLDLAGVAGTHEDAKKVVTAYAPVVAERMRERFGVELLSVSLLSAQTFFCASEISGVEDLDGKRIRTSTATVADVVTGLGGVPITMPFAEIVPALQRGVIDCVVTGTMSANTAKVYEVADYLFPVVVGWAPRVRFVNSAFWNGLDERQREWLTAMSDYLTEDVADPIMYENTQQGIWCSIGDDRCTLAGEHGVVKASMKLVEVEDADLNAVGEAVEGHVLPNFAASCGDECAAAWQASAGEEIGLMMVQ